MRRSTFKVAFFLKRTALKKSGKMPIVARVSINAKRAHFSTKLEINPEQWNVNQGKASGRTFESNSINAVLQEIKVSLTNIYHDLKAHNSDVSAEKVKNIFLGEDETNVTLLYLFNKHNDDMQKLVGIDTTLTTYKKYKLAARRIEEFLKCRYNLSDIFLSELSYNFIKDYELFLRVNCKLSNNVAAKMIMYLKKIVTIAFNNGQVASNPFANFHMKQVKVDRGFLTEEELATIMTKRIDIERLDQLRDIFLFCCWTGLSYIDIKQLTKDKLRKTSDGNSWICTNRQKTGAKIDILLLDIPKKIISKYEHLTESKYLLPVLSNQKCNSYLKELADICGIDKNLTFHMRSHIANHYTLKINVLQLLLA
ncbi:MAG: site-specific integrase [Rikenellaceae bacterium]